MNKGIIPNTLPKFIFNLRKKGKMIVSGTNGAGGNGERWEFPKVMSPFLNVIKGNNHPVKKEQCECGHDQYQHMGMDACQICTCKAFSLPSPHSEVWEKKLADFMFAHALYFRSDKQEHEFAIDLIIFINEVLHQTHEETVREIEGIVGDNLPETYIEDCENCGGDGYGRAWFGHGRPTGEPYGDRFVPKGSVVFCKECAPQFIIGKNWMGEEIWKRTSDMPEHERLRINAITKISKENKAINNYLSEQRQRLAQYKNSKGGI